MHYAVVKWIAPLIVVEIRPEEFDSPTASELLEKLSSFFKGAHVTVVTRSVDSSSEVRTRGLACPPELLTDPGLVWHELGLPEDPDIPF